jgi:serine/threonine protein kinase
MKLFKYLKFACIDFVEVVFGVTFSTQVDVWSLGCVLAEIYLQRPIFLALSNHKLVEHVRRRMENFVSINWC